MNYEDNKISNRISLYWWTQQVVDCETLKSAVVLSQIIFQLFSFGEILQDV
jgi:hypothetical protein